MKTTKLLCIASFAVVLTAGGQGFINFDFESATISPSQPPSDYIDFSTWVGVGAALPGWSAYIGTNQAGIVPYSTETIGTANISLVGPNGIASKALEGNFSVLLQAGLINSLIRTEVSLSQTGLVPLEAHSIQFSLNHFSPRPFTVSLDGQPLTLVPLEIQPLVTRYGADITVFAGGIRELKFTAFTPDGGLNNMNLDSIFFSPESIPEPSTFGLFALGALLLASRFLWRYKKTT